MMYQKFYLGLMLLFCTTEIVTFQKIATAQTPTLPKTSTKSICPAQLQSSLDTVINRPLFSRARWGILVKPLSSQETLYSQDAKKYFIPASNVKLFTTAAALEKLGANFRIRTSIYQDGDGILRVVGRGDPSLKDAQLAELATQLRQKGISQINQLISDDSYFEGDVIHPSWQWEDIQYYYGAPVNSLIVNENASILTLLPQTLGKALQIKWSEPTETYRWKIENNSITTQADQPGFVEVNRDLKGQIIRIKGNLAVNAKPDITALAVFDPVENFLTRFRQNLITAGISVKQTLNINGGKNDQEIAAIQSPPLSELLLETNINSNNLYAEALLRSLADKLQLEKNQSTADAGLEILKSTLTKLGVEPNSYIVVDGSGLSRKNLISPEALVQLLQVMAKSEVFRASLPVSGESGTLKYRFRNTSAEGVVAAKTGSMMGVVSLSGYVNVRNYQPLVFSIMVNQSEQPTSVIRKAMDEIVVLLSQLRRC